MNSYTATRNNPFAKLFSSNVTVNATPITPPAATLTEPSGDGVIHAGSAFNSLALMFYGTRTADDNETFTARISGWRSIKVSGVTLWIPVPLLALTLTQGAAAGVANSPIVATEYFADTIAVSATFTSAYEIISPADNTRALVKLDPFGCEKIQVQLVRGTNAACNGLWAGF